MSMANSGTHSAAVVFCKKFQKYRRTGKQGRVSKMFRARSTVYEYSMKRCSIHSKSIGVTLMFWLLIWSFLTEHVWRSLMNWTTLLPWLWVFACETAVGLRGRDLGYSWNFLSSFYSTLKFKQPYAMGSFSLSLPHAPAVIDPEKRFTNLWGYICYLHRTAACQGLVFQFTEK